MTETETDIERLTRERDEARERAAEVPGLRLRLAQAEGSASEAEAAWKTENGKLLASESRAASLSRELLDAMQARDSYRASADLRVGMRREFEELLGCGDTTGEEAFERGLIRLRALVAAEAKAERLAKALRASVVAMKRWSAEEDGLPVAPIGAHEAVAAAESIIGYVWAGLGPDPTRAALREEGK